MTFSGILVHPTILSFMREENPACDLSEKNVTDKLASLGVDKIASLAKNGVLHIWFDKEVSHEELARKAGTELSKLRGSPNHESVGEIASQIAMFIGRVEKAGRM